MGAVDGTTMLERAARAQRAATRARPWRIAAIALVLVLLIAVVGPIAMVSLGTRRATACLETYRRARGPRRPDCGGEMRWFLMPARVPWTSWHARYRAEELYARLTI